MTEPAILTIPRVDAPDLDEAFLPPQQWAAVPALSLVQAEHGDPASLPTDVRVAWSRHGLHLHFTCTDPIPLRYDTEVPILDEELVGVFLDPVGERNAYMAVVVTPCGRVAQAHIENRLHRDIEIEIDDSWRCPGLRTRTWSRENEWGAEIVLPFSGLTPALPPPSPADRWTGNLFRVERQPIAEISCWQPPRTTPPDLHASECFGVLRFG